MLDIDIFDAMGGKFYVIAFGYVGWSAEAPLAPLQPVLALGVGQAVFADGEVAGGGEVVELAWVRFEGREKWVEGGVGL